MTIGTATGRVSFSCNGTSTVFPVPLQAYQASDFEVILTYPAGSGGAEVVLTLNSDYSMVASGTLAPTAWTLTTTTAYQSGYTLQIILRPSQTQQTQYVEGQAFPSLALQTNVDRLTQMVIALQDQVGRSIRAPDGDVAPAMLLPIPSQRANLFAAFDANGNLSLAAALAAGQTLSQATIGQFLHPRTAAELAAGVTPSFFWYPPGWVRRYGALGDGVTDDTAALNRAGSIGVPVYFDPGTFLVATAGGVTFKTRVYGAGMGQSTIVSQIDGSGHVLPIMFTGSNIDVTGLTIKGSAYAPNNSGAALVNLGGTTGAHAVNVSMRGCEVTNATSFAVYCIYADGFLFEGNYVHDTGADGIHLGVCTDVRMNANIFNACVDDLIAITSLGAAANQNKNVVVDGNYCGMSTTGISRCILLESLVDARIINNVLYRVSGSAGQGMLELVRLATGNPSVNVTIQGNIVVNSASSGDCIFIYGGNSNIRVLDNYLSASAVGVNANPFTFGVIDNLEVSGNTCISTGSNGINIPNSTVGTMLKVCRNKINAFVSGLALNTNGVYNIVTDNDVTYNGQNASCVGISASPSTGGQLMQNVIAQSGGVTSGTNISVGSTISVKDNTGYVSESSGSTSIATGGTVNHGLSGTAAVVTLQQTGNVPSAVFPSAFGATTFQVNFAGGGTQGFLWTARTANALN